MVHWDLEVLICHDGCIPNVIGSQMLDAERQVEVMGIHHTHALHAFSEAVLLTSYLKGSALQLSRSGSETRNGFALWKTLVDHSAPATRQRALALSQAISSFPQYKQAAGKTLQEHIMSMEALVQQYDALNAKRFDRGVLLGILMRLCPEGIRQHLSLAITESTSYQEVRERILAYERSSRLWSVEDMVKPLNKQVDSSGVAPMEVDAVIYKGKGKGGKKGKGKKGNKGKGSWSDAWQ